MNGKKTSPSYLQNSALLTAHRHWAGLAVSTTFCKSGYRLNSVKQETLSREIQDSPSFTAGRKSSGLSAVKVG
ncbi:MAG: hypothetical protein IT490_01650 [Candidatus Contendobacter sp.]|nr:hypothetical protein [Candidatus Contendobacter sp.]